MMSETEGAWESNANIIEDAERLPANSENCFAFGWDTIVRTYSDAAIDRSALGVMSIVVSLVFGAKLNLASDDPTFKELATLISREDSLAAMNFLGLFFLVWFAGRMLTRLAPPDVGEWKVEDNYVSMKIRQVEKDEAITENDGLGPYASRQEQVWRRQTQENPVIRFFMTVLIRLGYLFLLVSILLILRATYKYLYVTFLTSAHF